MAAQRRHGFGSIACAGAIALAGLSLFFGCSSKQRAPAALEGFQPDFGTLPTDEAGPRFDVSLAETGINCALGEDAGICACKELGQKPTTLYIVLDRSGSMNEKLPPGTETNWNLMRYGLIDAKTGVLRKLGGRVSVGLALFPGPSSGDSCAVGSQVLPPTIGSTATYDKIGEILSGIMPKGATPTAPTLRALAPALKKLPAPAFVLLATDGAPNCASDPCPIERCTYNLERAMRADGTICDTTLNCCDATKVPEGMGWKACVDAVATKAAVADLAASGIKVFILGAPGTAYFKRDLDELAQAGGTAREDAKPGEPLYYAANDPTLAALTSALSAIAAKVIDDCIITLDEPPTDPGITNVLVDGVLVPKDEVDGWTWTPDMKVELRGKTCARVKAGMVSRVQVAVGCKTVTR